MPKFFDPVNHPKRALGKATINPNKITLDGGGSGTMVISINGIANTVNATYSGGYAATATAWVLANAVFFYNKGFVVSNTTTGSASALIVVTPRYGWDTVNRINVTGPTSDTLSATFIGTFEPNLNLAKSWEVTLNCIAVVKYPKNAVEGDRIRIVFKNTSNYTVTWDLLGFFFVGGTEPTVTTSGYTTLEGVISDDFYPQSTAMTLTGSVSGTANVVAGNIIRLATFNTTLTQTGVDFVTAWSDDFAGVGVTVTQSSGVLTFVPTTKTASRQPISIKNISGSLAGVNVVSHGGRCLVNTVSLDIKQ